MVDVVGPPIPPPKQPPPDDSTPFPWPDEQDAVIGTDAAGYVLWRCTCRVRYRSGWAMMPVAGDDSRGKIPSRPVKLSAAYSRVVVRYRAVRKGLRPKLPDPRPADANLVLLSADDHSFAVPTPDALNWVWTSVGKRVYGCQVPIFGPVDGLIVPSPVYSNASRASLNVSPYDFVPTI